ncbi:MAG: aminotransferase class III-fold pyridoxal phosphate-dependent enzyme, partial [Candidatus Kapabacteria bacterium]|nr:aminotransferase class III-fold pyridoxal phosphate-dependent enzyme [Candidatus Kapabacteria bacterium]
IGNYLKFELSKIDSDLVKEVRGRGLWIGLELNKPARAYCEKLMTMGLLCKDTHTYTIRLAPPLTLTMADADYILERIKKVLN